MLVGSGAASARRAAPSDGTLTVKNADGKIVINAKGGVIGRFDKGQVTVRDPNPNDGTGPIVTGADSTQVLGEKTTRYSGTKVRFRIIGGSFSITVYGADIDLSAIGKGYVSLNGRDAGDTDGTFAVNGGAPQPFPTFAFTFPLEAFGPGG